MKTKTSQQENIEKTLEMGLAISKVNVSPFFKGKVLNKIFEEKQEQLQTIFPWFTPKYQFAVLVCILVLNAYALIQYDKQNYNDNISTFAQAYELSSNEDTSIFN